MHLNKTDNAKLLLDVDKYEIVNLIDWNYFFAQWQVAGRVPQIFDHPTKGEEAKKLYKDALFVIDKYKFNVRAAFKIMTAKQVGDDVAIKVCDCCESYIKMCMLRNQTSHFMSLSDFVTAKYNKITVFALAVSCDEEIEDDYEKIMVEMVSNRLADAMQTKIVNDVQCMLDVKSLAFAFGYPACPDHLPKKIVFDLLGAQKNLKMTLTDNMAMLPLSSCCGIVVSHPNVNYFSVGKIGSDQLDDYARRCGVEVGVIKTYIPNNL